MARKRQRPGEVEQRTKTVWTKNDFIKRVHHRGEISPVKLARG